MTNIAPKKHLQVPCLHLALQLPDELRVAEFNDDDKDAAEKICLFNTTAYKSMDILVGIHQIHDVQHPLFDIQTVHVSELQASPRHHSVN